MSVVSTPAETLKSEIVHSDLNNDDNVSTVSNPDSAVSATTGKTPGSDGGKASAIPKPSGIKPPAPSRIGRLCTGQQHKPAVPTSPTKNGSDDALRRLTDDLGRHRLTDVQEENEDDFNSNPVNTTRRNRYSSIGSTASSMDYLWDLHPRRLSEAGLSGHSDNSTILTEDTDSFIIGQRVWVGGTKPGSIAYIGDTQFAPGEWAGIVLDQPIGKNDGSVGGIRYFQCESKKGVFSRLTRLTRYPLVDPEMGSGDTYVCSSTPLNNGTRRSPISPTGSLSLIRSPQSLNTSNTSLASTYVDFKIGDRVIIKSSQGSKIGTLRYIGITDFASGEWCGVELDDPRGKNDGSVEGKRYFECRPNFGLFAPVAKVSKSPSSRKPGSCVVHSGPGIPPSGFKKAGSKESLTSNASITSAASGVRRVRLGVTSLTTPQKVSPKTSAAPLPTRTALQEVLKEKQQHIEQLLKERDLERAEIAKAASQADEAEQKYITLRQEYEQYRAECESILKEHRDLLSKLKEDRAELVANLEDEKRKNEDLQFRFEEAAITKADLERKIQVHCVSNDANLARIKDLEAQLEAEREKTQHLEGDSNKLFEAEEALVRLREENEILRYEIEVATTKILAVEGENLTGKDFTNSLQTELNELQALARLKDEAMEKLKNEGQKLAEDYDAAKNALGKELNEYKAKTQALEAETSEQKTQIDLLRSELVETKKALDEKAKALEKSSTSNADAQEKLNKEISKLKMELSAKNLDLENNVEALKRKQEEIKNFKSQLDLLNDNLSSQDIHKENMKLIEATLKKELEDARATIKTKIIEVEESRKDFAVTLDQKETELKEANKTIQQYLADIEKLNESISGLKQTSSKTTQEMQETFGKKLHDIEGELVDATSQLKSKTDELEKASDFIRKVEGDVATKNEEIAKAQGELDLAKKRIETEAEAGAKLNEELTRLKLDFGDLQRKLATSEAKVAEMSEHKTKLEGEVQSLLGSSGDYSNKLEDLTQALRDKDKAIDSVKNELTQKLQEAERTKQELELKHNAHSEKTERDKAEFETQIKKLLSEKETIKHQSDELSSQNNLLVEDLNKKIKHLQDVLEEKENAAKKMQEESATREASLRGELTKTSGDLQTDLAKLREKIEDLTKENVEVREGLAKKTVELIELESKRNQFIEQSKQSENELKAAHEEQLRKLEFERRESENHLNNSIELIKKQLSDQLENSTCNNQELEAKYNRALQENQLEKAQLEDQIKNHVSQRNLLEEEHGKYVSENAEILKGLHAKIQEQEKMLLEKDGAFKKSQDEARRSASDLKEQLGKACADLQGNLLESEKKIHELVQDNETLRQKSGEFEVKYSELVAASQQTETRLKSSHDEEVAKLRNEFSERETQLQKFKGELEQMKDVEASKVQKEEEIRQLKTELQINHQFVEKLRRENQELQRKQEDVSKLQEEQSKQCLDLTEKLNELSDEASKTSKALYELESGNNLYVTLLQLLQLTEKQKKNLIDQVGTATKNEDGENFAKLFKVVDSIKVVSYRDEEQERKLSEAKSEVELLQKMLQESDLKFKAQEAEKTRLQNELLKASEVSKTRNVVVSSKIPTKVDNTTKALNNNNVVSNEQLLEEKLLAESQVAFLNSIIVDIQKKNEEQKMRIELLESGYSPAAVEELKLIGLGERQLPPRMYCDICEEFDLHETEDCPQQATDDAPAPSNKPPKERPPERPYCEICEVFGHSTEDCNDDQTF